MSDNNTSVMNDDQELTIVKEILGFDPKDFFLEVNSAVSQNLTQAMTSFRQELSTISRSKGYKLKEHDIDAACTKLLNIMQESIQNNFDTFELYTRRNIFSLPTPQESSPVKNPTPMKSQTKQLEKLNEEIDAIKTKYLELQYQHRILLNECSDNDRLLKDMRSALFHLRVGAQVLDENSIQPLDETIRSIIEYKNSLIDLSAKAADLNTDIRSRLQLDTRAENRSARQYDEIRTANAEDLEMLSEMLVDDDA